MDAPNNPSHAPRRLMGIFAHPDDETLGLGPVIAKYAAEGVEVSLITATRGERGWFDDEASHPGLEALGQAREAELRAAARTLGITRIDFLDVVDGEMAHADAGLLVSKIVRVVRQVRPQVVVSFGPDGDYGHPDHIAISQLAAAALLCAADAHYQPETAPAHRVSKFYYMITGEKTAQAFRDIDLQIDMEVDGVRRTTVVWPEWAITTRVRASEYLPFTLEAIRCHQTQLPSLPGLETMPLSVMNRLMGELTFYRALSLVNRSSELEDDLFCGIDEDGEASGRE
jgi:LmbE family N-acetylglucosaminyl deacetylase